MYKKIIVFAIAFASLAGAYLTTPQGPGKVYRIGYLSGSRVSPTFRQALRDLGYMEGKNLTIEHRRAKRLGQYPSLAAELIRLKVDLILTVGIAATRAAKHATNTIPIVMGNSSADPVRQGLVKSLAQPGGNVTGIFDIMSDLAEKRLKLLKETFPRLTRVAHLSAQAAIPGKAHLKKTEAAAHAVGIRLQVLEVTSPDDLENAFRAAVEGDAEALVVVGVSFFIPHRKRIIDLESQHGLPAMHTHRGWVSEGGLMSYTTDNGARYRRAAEYVDRILKGTKPADLPVEQATTFVYEINLKTAKTLGITIPPTVLYQATKVVQ